MEGPAFCWGWEGGGGVIFWNEQEDPMKTSYGQLNISGEMARSQKQRDEQILEGMGLSEKGNWLRTQGKATLSNTHSDGDGRKDNRSYKAKRLSHKMPDSVPRTQDVMKTKL